MLPSRHDLYERCVQNPAALVPFLVALHGRSPRVLAEDFCATAAISREWLRVVPNGEAHAVDHNVEAIAEARRRCDSPGLQLECEDVMDAAAPAAEVIFVGNYSIGYCHERPALVRYLARCRGRLAEHGIFVCDTYGGESAFRRGAIQRIVPLNDRTSVRYTWEHRDANAWTGMVTNAVHFRVERDGTVVQDYTDAFVYHWRLWSVPELREAMLEVGFASVEVRETLDAGMIGTVPSSDFAVTLTARVG